MKIIFLVSFLASCKLPQAQKLRPGDLSINRGSDKLVVLYSRTGNTAEAGLMISKLLNADYKRIQVAPGIGVPHPDSYYGVEPPWSKPQQTIDIRDVVEIAPDQLAPWGYVEHMPGWWVPDPSRP